MSNNNCQTYFHNQCIIKSHCKTTNNKIISLSDSNITIYIDNNQQLSVDYIKIEDAIKDCQKDYNGSMIDFLLFYSKIFGFEMKAQIDSDAISQVQKFFKQWFQPNIRDKFPSIQYEFYIVYRRNNLSSSAKEKNNKVSIKKIKEKTKLSL